MSPHVRKLVGCWSVGWLVGWSVNFFKRAGGYTFHTPVGALVLCNCMKEEASKKADGGVKGSFSIPMTLPNNRYEGFLLGAQSDRAALEITLSVRP